MKVFFKCLNNLNNSRFLFFHYVLLKNVTQTEHVKPTTNKTFDDRVNHRKLFHQTGPESVGLRAILNEAVKLRDEDLKRVPLGLNISTEEPLRIVIASSWRSGSTFMAAFLSSVPGAYYHYEPLNLIGIQQVRSENETTISYVDSLIRCDYSNLDEYLKYLHKVPDMYTYNHRWKQVCKKPFNTLCLRKEVMQELCSIHPIQILKTVRVRLRLISHILKTKNTKILYLFRDPRGTLQSRKHRDWCPKAPDCIKPEFLCSDLVDDHKAAVNLKKKFPHQFFAIRYEDFSSKIELSSKKLLKDASLPWNDSTKEFLDKHTKTNKGGPWSTFRNSKTAPFHWIKELSKSEISKIQTHCQRAMELWGYRSIDFDKYDPLVEFESIDHHWTL